ncbi:MAG: hypothetical protein OXU69_17055 [Gemmatimonadota bacterium]|nr:hypothetical protein [Gemmatimonadota bacterium]
MDIWYFDREGQLAGPPSLAPSGKLLGLFSDESLVIAGAMEPGLVDTRMVSAIMSVPPAPAGNEPLRAREPELLFLTAIPKDPTLQQYNIPARWGHAPWHTSAVAGDTIWTVPSERPELLAVHRTGEVLLKVRWEAGDRTIPPEASAFGRGAERHPAARSLEIGTDGLIYVQRLILRDGGLLASPEWLVFSPAGELLARLDIPDDSQHVLAFGDGVVVTTGQNEVSGVGEVRYYELTRTPSRDVAASQSGNGRMAEWSYFVGQSEGKVDVDSDWA